MHRWTRNGWPATEKKLVAELVPFWKGGQSERLTRAAAAGGREEEVGSSHGQQNDEPGAAGPPRGYGGDKNGARRESAPGGTSVPQRRRHHPAAGTHRNGCTATDRWFSADTSASHSLSYCSQLILLLVSMTASPCGLTACCAPRKLRVQLLVVRPLLGQSTESVLLPPVRGSSANFDPKCMG